MVYNRRVRILGIETSCDDTAAAIYAGDQGLIVHQLASQTELHAHYGGVVPELAARDHIRTLLPLIDAVLHAPANAGRAVDGVAYTAGPGLAGALLVGASVGRSLAAAWGVPSIGVHHMEGHLLASMLEPQSPQPPFVALLVSGGHCLLVDVKAIGDYAILGQTLDDAAGEAFDKTATLLGLGYPGGPAIARAAVQGRADRFAFPRPMINRPGLDFSFSGLKTAARHTSRKHQLDRQTVCDIARAFEEAVVDTLCIKSVRALQQTGRQALVVAGGVGANLRLRSRIKAEAAKSGARIYCPRVELCTDNGAMIAYAGYLRMRSGQAENPASGAEIRPRWRLDELAPAGAA